MEKCPCKRTKCERHGNCTECRDHHENVKHMTVACDRIKAREEKRKEKSKCQKS